MTKKIAIILVVMSFILAVISFIVLPSSVITQFSLGSENVTKMPKVAAIAIPFLLGTVGGLLSFFSKNYQTKNKTLIISAVGILIFIFMIAVNIFFIR
jgi:hypothetical protein